MSWEHSTDGRSSCRLVAQIQWEVMSIIMFRRNFEQSAMSVRLVQIWKLQLCA
jgi:hypothetical protein